MKTLLKAGIPFGFIMGMLSGLILGPYYGLVIFVVSGLSFGGIIAIFLGLQERKFKAMEGSMAHNHPILFSGPANHRFGKEYTGGWLILTEEKLIFKTHHFNIQNHELEIENENITNIKGMNAFGFIPNKLSIEESSGEVHCFVVNNRSKWLECINKVNL